ncbi:MAG TPA: hypothetical protein VGN35_10325 [Jatrophihabitantaceae bacterium]|nr:hypothetical protein [Jatrophihabitantaceae bacterium]
MKSFAVSALAVVSLALTACSHSAGAPSTTTTNTIVRTQTSAAPGKAIPAAFAGNLGPGDKLHKGEVEKNCPYIKSTHLEDPVGSVAVIEGDRVGRTTVLPGTKPEGCRFYFAYGPYEAVADIQIYRYDNHVVANNTMVATAKAGLRAEGIPNLIPGVPGVVFQTKFNKNDGNRDWACAFAKGSLVVIVHTQQNDTSFNAKALATAVAPKIPA